jgi:hypothetical protein
MIKTTVTAHTGSTKFGTYKVVTGELREYRRRNIGPNHYTLDVVIIDAEGVEYVTGKGRVIGEVVTVIEDTEGAPVEVEAEPKKIAFERTRCGRCKGAGRRSDGGWGANNGGRCFRCNGTGTALTANGVRASEALRKMRDERLGATWGELAEGEGFWYDNRCYLKGQHPSLILREATEVHRHNGAITRQMWKEITVRYKGATLIY